jgi:hypothetical protein
MKITNYKSQITKINKKRITTIIMGHDVEMRSTMTVRI